VRLVRFALDRRVTVLVLLATLLVVGLVSALSIPLELFPRNFTSPFLALNVPWQDAPAQEVLDKIVLPLEEELSTVRGVENVASYARTGFGRLELRFKRSADMNVAYREVRDRVERARARLPEDADKVFLRKDDVSGIPVSFVGLVLPEELTDPYDLVQKGVVMPLERVEGVASVTPNGLGEKEILIELDRQRTEAAGLNIYLLAQDLQGDNFTLASGNVRTGERKLLLRSVARYADREALENRLVAPSVRLKDVARVSYEEPDAEYSIRVNSKPAVGIEIIKEGEANTIEVSRRIRETVAALSEDPRLEPLGLEVLFDQGDVVMESLNSLLDSGKIGGLFAIAVLFFFLRRLRMTLIIALSIPLSVVIALTFMFFGGETLNILSLLGLMICVGLLVDNSVVVAENIYRLHAAGRTRRQAAVEGTREIALAVVMATLTTVAVFLPVSLVDGQAQFFLLRLSVPISVSLLGSLLIALVFVPLAAYLTLPVASDEDGAVDEAPPGRVARLRGTVDRALTRAYDQTLGRVNEAYGRVLTFFLHHRLDLVLLLFAVIGLTGWLLGEEKVRFVAQDENSQNGFRVQVELPETYTFEDTQAYFREAEAVMEAHEDEWGLDGYLFFHRTRGGNLDAWLDPDRESEITPRQLTEQVMEIFPQPPGVKLYTGSESGDTDEKLALAQFTLHGEDPDELARTAEVLRERFAAAPGVVGVRNVDNTAPNELALVVDRERAQRQSINPMVIAGVVGSALRGQSLPEFYVDGREVPVRVRFEEADRESLAELSGFEVPLGLDGSGDPVSLASVTEVEYLSGTQVIRRQDKRMTEKVTVELEEGREEEAREGLKALQERFDLPEGVTWGDAEKAAGGLDEEALSLLFAAGVSVVFIYFLMAFLFESLVLPLSILTTIPLAGLGVVWLHLLAGRSIDFLGMVGLVLLIGVVVNNGIVLIDYVNRLRRSGMERMEALVTACRRRFRPIMMTALTTIFGMVPLTLGGTSSIGMSYVSFGYTLIGGLTTATLLTLLVVPVLYTLIEDGRAALGRVVARRQLSGRAVMVADPSAAS
jgi:hydrophobic/amphiphilic exporter-1 (mainly G- bacteria), HAE1 family